MGLVSKLFGFLLLAAMFLFANENLRFADSCYAVRAEGANGDKADIKNVHLMKDAYRKAMEDSSILEKATQWCTHRNGVGIARTWCIGSYYYNLPKRSCSFN